MKGVGTWETYGEKAEDGKCKAKKGGGFQTMGLGRELFNGILKMGYNVPTPIQRKAIYPLMQRADVVAMARTGSGKTAAYLIPLIHSLKEHSKIVGIRGLILSPTRELSLQIWRHCTKLARYTDLTFATLVGGDSIDKQFETLASNPDVVVATPGRLLHICEESGMQLSAVRIVVLDEADRLFELGLQPQIVSILQRVPENAQRALFSATMPSLLAEFTKAGLHDPVVIRLDAEMKLSEKLKQAVFVVRAEEKLAGLLYTLKHVIKLGEVTTAAAAAAAREAGERKALRQKGKKRSKVELGLFARKTIDHAETQALIFVESKHHVDMLEMLLEIYGFSTVAIHGQMDQEARRNAVAKFARRKAQLMVVTDVAARGIDLPLLDNVINFSFPYTPKLYVHRVGRVARAGRSGSAYSLITVEELPYFFDLFAFLDREPICEVKEGDFFHRVDDGCYGRLPEVDLQMEIDFIRKQCAENSDLAGLIKVSDHSHSKYEKVKKKASKQGMVDAKSQIFLRSIDTIPVHPMIKQQIGDRMLEADSAKINLRQFKPKGGEHFLELLHNEKLFEIRRPETMQSLKEQRQKQEKENQEMEVVAVDENEPPAAPAANEEEGEEPSKPLSFVDQLIAKQQQRKQQLPTVSLADRMTQRAREKKRAREENGNNEANELEETPFFFDERRAGKAGDASSSLFRDAAFFMPLERKETIENAQYSVADAAVDINADTAEDIRQQRHVFAWDKKKHRYTKVAIDSAKAMLKGIKNEAGKSINFKTKLDTYIKWTKKSNMRIQDVGEEEDLGAVARSKKGLALAAGGGAAEEGDDGEEINLEEVEAQQAKRKAKVSKRKARHLTKDGLARSADDMLARKKVLEKRKVKEMGKRERKAMRAEQKNIGAGKKGRR